MVSYSAESASLTSSQDHGIAHNVEVSKLLLTNWKGEKLDIKNLFLEMNIYNSIFEPGIYGNILIQDASALLTRFPIIGEEQIDISFNTPGNAQKTFHGVITRVSDIAPDSKGASSSYVLHFCTEEFIINSKENVAKSYKNTLTAEKIVEDLLTTFLQSEKKLDIDPCIEPQKVFCVPYLSPYDAIEMLRKRVRSKDTEEHYFLFFERFDGIYMKNLYGLLQSPLNKENNYYAYISDKFGNQRNQGIDMRRIMSLSINSKFNTLEKIEEGMLANESFEYSFDDKYVYSQLTSYNDVNPYLGNKRMNTKDFIDKQISGFTYGLMTPISSFKERRQDQNFFFVKPTGKNLINKVMLNQLSITITVPGDSTVDIGDIVTVKIPEFDADANESVDDPHLSGRYIIGSIRNIFLAPDKHSMQMDLYKDGFNSEITGMTEKLKKTIL